MTTMGGTSGKGSHASLSRFDMNNTLVAHGPDFKRGMISDTPSGNVDVAPTILWLLGVEAPPTMDGRVLHEALAHSTGKPPTPEPETLEASRNIGLFQWQQYLKFTRVGTTRYFDEGNGQAGPRQD
jgi:arylsulfatase A-like enzyme